MLRLDDFVVAVPGGGGRWRVSARVPAGQLVVVAAHPAAGTALARTVAGLTTPAGGTLWLGEQDITTAAPVQRHIGYVPHGGGLLPQLTVRANIEYGLRRRQTVHKMSRSWVHTVIDRLELGPTLHLRPHLLSDAQRLRVAVGRAVACLPEVLVFDLPYGASVRLRDLLARAASPVTDLSALVCSADPAVRDEADQVVAPLPAGRPGTDRQEVA